MRTDFNKTIILDFDDFADFEETPVQPAPTPIVPAAAPTPVVTAPSITLGPLVTDIEKLCTKGGNVAESESDKSIEKRVLSLFDCVNAGALDFSWRNRFRGFFTFLEISKF